MVTNGGVLIAASGTVVAAIWSAVKKIKSAIPDDASQRVVAGLIMDHVSLNAFTESNRAVSSDLRELTSEMKELRFVVTMLLNKTE